MENPIEEKQIEIIPEKQDILEIVNNLVEGSIVVREKSDDIGLYLLEIRVNGVDEGTYTEYVYVREGDHEPKITSITSSIYSVDYEGDVPVGGSTIANVINGAWEMVPR
jgi:hypothetical protein